VYLYRVIVWNMSRNYYNSFVDYIRNGYEYCCRLCAVNAVILGSILGIFIGSILISYKVFTEEIYYKIITTMMFIKQNFMKK
jgi:hypothetical protein